MNRRIASIISLVFLIIFLLYLMIAPNKDTSKKIDIDSTKNRVLNDIEEMKNYVEKTAEWAGEENDDSSYYTFSNEENSYINPKEDVLNYLITGLMDQNVDVFLSSFYPETISKDLFKISEPDKRKVTKDIINQISRNDRLFGIKYSEVEGAFGSSTNKIKVHFEYNDNKSVTINLVVISVGDSHHEDNKTYVITTSAWEIIKQINGMDR